MSRRRSVLLRPSRSFRRWARHTPNAQIASALIGVGLVLVAVAIVLFAVL